MNLFEDDPRPAEPDWSDPADEAYSDWLDAHENDDFDLGAEFRAEIDAEIDRASIAHIRHLTACAHLAA